ncbi:aquaporin Z [Pseudoxanthomonas putridarboris]
MMDKLFAEFLGTFWLVLCGCGSAILAAQFGGDGNPLGIGLLGVSLAFGLAVLTGAYAFGHLSGAHFNPAVSVGLWVGGRFPGRLVLPYMLVQVAGATCAGYLLTVIASGAPYFTIDPFAAGALASNGYGVMSPGGYSLETAFLVEMVLTAFFVIVIMGVTDRRAPAGFAPIAIGLALTLIHLVGIPVTNTSVNPARSTGVALFAHYTALHQLWLFWLAPLLGGAAGGIVYSVLGKDRSRGW